MPCTVAVDEALLEAVTSFMSFRDVELQEPESIAMFKGVVEKRPNVGLPELPPAASGLGKLRVYVELLHIRSMLVRLTVAAGAVKPIIGHRPQRDDPHSAEAVVLLYDAVDEGSGSIVSRRLHDERILSPGLRQLRRELAGKLETDYLRAFLSTVGSVESAPLRLSEIVLEHPLAVAEDLVSRILAHSQNSLTMQLLKVPISVDLLGNPAGLVKRLGSGMRSFLYEPVVAMSGGPSNVGVGIFRGTSALAKQTAIGLSDAVAKVSGQVSKVTGLMAGASSASQAAAALVRARARHMDEDHDPDDLTEEFGDVEVEDILVEDDAAGWAVDAVEEEEAEAAAAAAEGVVDVGPYPLFADATLTHRRRVLEAMLHSVEPRGIEDALPLALRGYNPGLFVEDARLVARASLSALLRLVARPATGFFGFARALSASLRSDRRDVQRVRPARCIPASRVLVPYSLHAALGQLLMVNALVPRNRAQLVAFEEGNVSAPCWGERYVMHCNPVTLLSDTLLLTSHRILVLDDMGAVRWSGLLRDVQYVVASTNDQGDFLLTVQSAASAPGGGIWASLGRDDAAAAAPVSSLQRQLNFGPGTQHVGRTFYNALTFLLLTQRVTHAG
jgi:hypothetical protein